MSAQIIEGDVFDILPTIPAGSIDAVCTSPPYWMLRSYLPKDHALKHLELGSEPTPAEWVANQIRVLRLVRDCLADHGTVFWNVGDTYVSHKPRENATHSQSEGFGSQSPAFAAAQASVDLRGQGWDSGNLCLIPWRLAIAAQDDGWLVRSVIVWHKPAPMPSSVQGWSWRRCRVKVRDGNGYSASKGAPRPDGTVQRNPDSSRNPDLQAQWSDCPGCPKCAPHGGLVLRRGKWRPTSSWEPVLMLAKGAGYYADGDAVKVPFADARLGNPGNYRNGYSDEAGRNDGETKGRAWLKGETGEASGANLRDVWTIAAEPLAAKHYAAFPSELVYRCLAAGTSARGYCVHCSAPWARVVETTAVGSYHDHSGDGTEYGMAQRTGRPRALDGRPSEADAPAYKPPVTLGWRQTCPCPPHEPRPGRVLDPFCGSGRTAIQARRLGLDFTGVELNPEYVRMARELIRADSPLFG